MIKLAKLKKCSPYLGTVRRSYSNLIFDKHLNSNQLWEQFQNRAYQHPVNSKINIKINEIDKEVDSNIIPLQLVKENEKNNLVGCLIDSNLHSIHRPILKEGTKVELIMKNQLKDLSDINKLEQLNKLANYSSPLILLLAQYRLFGKRQALALNYESFTSKLGFYTDFGILKNSIEGHDILDLKSLSKLSDDKFLGSLSEKLKEDLTATFKSIISEKIKFEKLTVESTKILDYLPNLPADKKQVNLYKLDDLIITSDLPVVNHTGHINTFEITNSELAHTSLLNSEPRQVVTRNYGISFLHVSHYQKHQKAQESAKESDHRIIGQQQQLFMTHELSPGAPFFLPHGTRIIQRLQTFLRELYQQYKFEEVVTPLVYKQQLFETSGHWDNYREDMFEVVPCCDNTDKNTGSGTHLKPMNCPAHCLIFKSQPRSFLDLPIRFADFGTLHRNEASGALTGLTRVRQFHQDDGHAFCAPHQVGSEISSNLDMLSQVYQKLGLTNYQFALSTRPPSHTLGAEEAWTLAETELKQALENTGRPWTIKEGDGAFYGPKIDIMVTDPLGKSHQTATLQLDYQLPQRFELKFRNADNLLETPVIIHRAMFGSLERMLALLMEIHKGKWPYWLNPRQVIILTVDDSVGKYTQEVFSKIRNRIDNQATIYVDTDISNKSLSNKIKAAQALKYNFMVVIGNKEMQEKTITIRTRDGKVDNSINVDAFADSLVHMQRNRVL